MKSCTNQKYFDLTFNGMHAFAMQIRHCFDRLKSENIDITESAEAIAGGTFPHGWCDMSSCVLGAQASRFFGSTEINLVTGRNNGQCHVWIRANNWDIDITSDQFDWFSNSVVIEECSKIHVNHFPDPIIEPFVSRTPYSHKLERIILELDFVIRAMMNDWITNQYLIRASHTSD